MTTEPYASAQRVFWIVDNGTIHRGHTAVDRLQGAWPNLVLVHLPTHASWLNQIEIYVRHEAPCGRRARTINSQPCRLGCRPRADAAVR
jgi:DDE superfamily endonuclease